MKPLVVFAIGIEQLIPVIFVLIGIVSWIMNAIKDRRQEPERPVRRAKNPRDESLQNEIDIFIQEVTDQRNQTQPRQPAQQPKPQPVRRPPARTQTRPEPPRTPKKEPPNPVHQRPGDSIASRKGPGSTDLGQGVARHVQQHIESHSVGQESEQRLGHGVQQSVLEHLGKSSSAETSREEGAPESTVIQQVRRLMSSPSSMGQAILINEILSPPRARRR